MAAPPYLPDVSSRLSLAQPTSHCVIPRSSRRRRGRRGICWSLPDVVIPPCCQIVPAWVFRLNQGNSLGPRPGLDLLFPRDRSIHFSVALEIHQPVNVVTLREPRSASFPVLPYPAKNVVGYSGIDIPGTARQNVHVVGHCRLPIIKAVPRLSAVSSRLSRGERGKERSEPSERSDEGTACACSMSPNRPAMPGQANSRSLATLGMTQFGGCAKETVCGGYLIDVSSRLPRKK